MSPAFKKTLVLLIPLGVGLVISIPVLFRKESPTRWDLRKDVLPAPGPPLPSALSVLGETPDWSALGVFQETITRDEFERLLTGVFVTGEAWRNFIEIRQHEAIIRTGGPGDADAFHLSFAPPGTAHAPSRAWRGAADLPPAPPERPLDGLKITIDPGHIGGPWARIEERWMQIGDTPPVCEGDLTLLVARLLKPRLEKLGAEVTLTRDKTEPVTPLRPESLMTSAADAADPADSPAALQKLAERLFYRTAEIRARARLVNQLLKPDLVLCLHFNADPWGDPANPTLVERSHLHFLLNGAYTDEEVCMADQRFAMLEKLLSGTHREEARVGATVADVFARKSGLPPYAYPAGSRSALPVDGHPYLWARNLLANRLYQRPVIFAEPYLMNSATDHPRIVAGDYDGMRMVNGRMQPSIFREYADALAEGLAEHYAAHRGRN